MNYRHHFHAGNYADVMKHVLLVRLVRALQRKPKGCVLVDTHAGRGEYDLSLASRGDSLVRKPEHPDGIGRLMGRSDLPEPVADYLELVRGFDLERGGGEGAGPRFYPGSPWILTRLAREQDRVALCERHPGECAALRDSLGRRRRVSIQEMDGYRAPAAYLPPPEGRALVLVDPPFEDENESAFVAKALRESVQRLPAGTNAIWYPLTQRLGPAGLTEAIRRLPLPPTVAFELLVAPAAAKMRGCGVAIVNPPWKFEDEVMPTLNWLAEVLSQGNGASASCRWLMPE
jgi:23S rRNA (adenine2030-N6)-methyltransferase